MTKLMLDPAHPLAELLRRDQRYHFDAYVFVFDALRYAQEHLDMGQPTDIATEFELDEDDQDSETPAERHVSGQQLCEAIRQYALNQYGLLAKSVLNHWGVGSTADFGEIVFNLIDIGQMKKTENDRREDFDEVYDFADGLVDTGVFTVSDSSEENRA